LPKPQKEPLRVLGEQERQTVQRIVRATSERLDVIKRARALLAVATGQSCSAAAREAGFASSDTVCRLVARFNRQGILALLIGAGRGRQPTYSHEDRQKVVETLKSEPVRKVDASATWSLSLVQHKLRETGEPSVGASTIGRVLHQAGYAYGQSRTWCQTGMVLRKLRKRRKKKRA
jgi:transposase